MTSLLAKMLREEFPDDGKDSFSQLGIYGADERVYLTLYNKVFSGKNVPLISLKEIKDIASKIFADVNFEFLELKEAGNLRHIISFETAEYKDRIYRGASHRNSWTVLYSNVYNIHRQQRLLHSK